MQQGDCTVSNGNMLKYRTRPSNRTIVHLYEGTNEQSPQISRRKEPDEWLTPASTELVAAHLGVDFLRPGINTATEAADILKAVTHEIGGGIEAVFALMIDDDDGLGVGAATHELLHHGLGEQNGAIDVDGLEFLAGTDIHELHGGVLLDERGEVGGPDEDFFILLVTGGDVGEDFVYIQVAIAGTDLGEGFGGLETATAAAANVIAAEQGALGAGEFFQDGAHGRLGIEIDDGTHQSFSLHSIAGSVHWQKSAVIRDA